MSQVVVLFTGEDCDEYDDMPCVMDVLGPYDEHQAKAVMELYLAEAPWTTPHRLILHDKGALQ